MTTITDGAQSHGLDDLNGHFVDICDDFTDISQRWSIDQENDICVLYQKMRRIVLSNENASDTVRPEHDINYVE